MGEIRREVGFGKHTSGSDLWSASPPVQPESKKAWGRTTAVGMGILGILAVSGPSRSAHAGSASVTQAKGSGDDSQVLHREPPWIRTARLARERSAASDCVGALSLFDQAIELSHDPTLRRDRGACHERLGHTFPAIDDYRAYLTEAPQAADAEGIRERFQRLQGETSVPKLRDKSFTSYKAAGVNPGDFESFVRHERAEFDADLSPLRRGKGVVFGPMIDLRKWNGIDASDGYLYGATVRYSFSSVSSALLEVGGAGINSADGSADRFGGFATFLGYEARVGLNSTRTHVFYLGGGAGYEGYTQVSSALKFGAIVGRGRLGYRLSLGPSFALEVGGDGGFASIRQSDNGVAKLFFDSATMYSGHAAALVGF